jgi:hypothetical protein
MTCRSRFTREGLRKGREWLSPKAPGAEGAASESVGASHPTGACHPRDRRASRGRTSAPPSGVTRMGRRLGLDARAVGEQVCGQVGWHRLAIRSEVTIQGSDHRSEGHYSGEVTIQGGHHQTRGDHPSKVTTEGEITIRVEITTRCEATIRGEATTRPRSPSEGCPLGGVTIRGKVTIRQPSETAVCAVTPTVPVHSRSGGVECSNRWWLDPLTLGHSERSEPQEERSATRNASHPGESCVKPLAYAPALRDRAGQLGSAPRLGNQAGQPGSATRHDHQAGQPGMTTRHDNQA